MLATACAPWPPARKGRSARWGCQSYAASRAAPGLSVEDSGGPQSTAAERRRAGWHCPSRPRGARDPRSLRGRFPALWRTSRFAGGCTETALGWGRHVRTARGDADTDTSRTQAATRSEPPSLGAGADLRRRPAKSRNGRMGGHWQRRENRLGRLRRASVRSVHFSLGSWGWGGGGGFTTANR